MMNTKQFKALDIEIKADTNKRTIEAYASTFGNRDLVGDIVTAGAFQKTIQERWAGGSKNGIKVLWQHMPSIPLGLPQHMEEDSKGLYTVSYISKTDWGNRALELANDRVVDKMSIGYDVIKDDYSTEGARLLQELKLYEYSLVTFPANEQADILGVKSMDQLTNMLDLVGAHDLTGMFNGQKAGAVLSQGNVDKLKRAIEALNELLTAAGIEGDKGAQSSPGVKNIIEEEINPQELQLILSSFKSINDKIRV